jgi:hypothetical protein
VYGKERKKKNIEKKERKINICVWENEKKEKEKRGVAIKIWEGWIKWKEK